MYKQGFRTIILAYTGIGRWFGCVYCIYKYYTILLDYIYKYIKSGMLQVCYRYKKIELDVSLLQCVLCKDVPSDLIEEQSICFLSQYATPLIKKREMPPADLFAKASFTDVWETSTLSMPKVLLQHFIPILL